MRRVAAAAAIAGVVLAVNGAMYVATMPAAATTVVGEDEAGWNCFTMGNNTCGVDTYFESDDNGRGAVLPVANDGIVYVAWTNGVVTPATTVQREAAWNTCVDYATGGDASLFACDDDFQNPGDQFTK